MNIIFLILSILGTLYGLWFAAVAVLGSLKKTSPAPAAAPRHRLAVLVPARNEAGVVGYLVRSLMNQEYPRELYDVFVIPNGCTDDTAAVAAQAGAKIVECTASVHSKGDVLRFAFENLSETGDYDGYCILDADNLAAPGFLRAANDMLCAGWQVAQGYRDSKNPSDSWVAGDTSIFFWLMNRFYSRARSALGMSTALNGTGIVMTRELVERLGWNMSSLTEDLEFSGLCAANGVRIGYMEAGVIYDEQPVRLADSIVQRRRWSAGTIQCLRIFFGRLLKRRSLHALDMMLVFMGSMAQVVCMIPGVIGVVKAILQVARGDLAIGSAIGIAAAMLAAAYAGGALFALLICALEKKLRARMLPSILMFPFFLVTWFIANIWAIATRPPKWTQIAHVRGTQAPD
jgi:cellulose synthase/poly-beta-1,6-N-acetylglucosamine synthase-like glycosyltransferase